jgi:hypothetical protein
VSASKRRAQGAAYQFVRVAELHGMMRHRLLAPWVGVANGWEGTLDAGTEVRPISASHDRRTVYVLTGPHVGLTLTGAP